MTPYRDQSEDEEDEWDAEDDADIGDDSDDEPTVPCPYCERFISAEDHAGPKKPLWIIATALVCLGVALWWVFAAF
jgi:hypothetical protein